MTTWKLRDLIQHASETCKEAPDGRWVPARPMPGPFVWRMRAAWRVLNGKADAVEWPDD